MKKGVFERLDAIVKPEAILATNTSTLDVDAMAAVTSRPERFAGLHFFVPANIMPLLEIVRGAKTSPETIATAFAVAKALRKTAVLSGNAFGFIGNRMIFDYAREAIALAEEGVAPARVDAVMKAFGFPMGPFAMSDLSGIDVAWHIAKSRGDEGRARTRVLDRLVEMKRLGQKSMAGYFKYDKSIGKGREPIPDQEVEALFAEEARRAGVAPRPAGDDEIRDRLLYALVNRGAYLLADGVALRPGDIDVVYVYGYGFPPHRGGPMWYADEVGVDTVYERVKEFRDAFGPQWTPAPLLASIAEKGGTFARSRRPARVRACVKPSSFRQRARRSAARFAARSIKRPARRWPVTRSNTRWSAPRSIRSKSTTSSSGAGLPEGATGNNIGRTAALRAGCPVSVAGQTVSRYCASGLDAIASGAQRVIADGAA